MKKYDKMNWLEKLFHRHNWVYYGYVPYINKNTPHGAGYRKCVDCKKKQTNWN